MKRFVQVIEIFPKSLLFFTRNAMVIFKQFPPVPLEGDEGIVLILKNGEEYLCNSIKRLLISDYEYAGRKYLPSKSLYHFVHCGKLLPDQTYGWSSHVLIG